MTTEQAISANPSPELLAEAAQRVGAAYSNLYAHQRTGIAFLLSHRRPILADDMGLGKTRQAIIALREAVPFGTRLVICPAGVKLNWKREILMVEPQADIHVVANSKTFEPGHLWTIVNYDLLGKLLPKLLAENWTGVIADEAHFIKKDSQRSDHVLKLLGVGKGKKADFSPEFVYLLTGTPMSNRPRDLFNLLKVVQHPLAKSFYNYAKRYCAAYDNGFGLDTNGASDLEELAGIVSGILLRRTKDEALDLPPKVRTWQPVDIDGKASGALEARALAYLQKNPARSGSTWVNFLGMLNKARHALAVAKIPATIEAVRDRVEAGEKIVVFSSYTAVIEAVTAEFGASAVSITGSDSAVERQAAADALQNDLGVKILVGNLQAAGVGINLTAATHVVFNDLDWVPGNHWQAEDRIYRIGQHRPAFVTYLIAENTLDDFVAALLEAKARNIGVLETQAAHTASLLQGVVDAALRGEKPQRPASEPAGPTTERSVGLLDETLDLLARAGRGLAAIDSAEQQFQVASKSRPGEAYTVTLSGGALRCECPGFEYRGNCSHMKAIAGKVAAGTN